MLPVIRMCRFPYRKARKRTRTEIRRSRAQAAVANIASTRMRLDAGSSNSLPRISQTQERAQGPTAGDLEQTVIPQSCRKARVQVTIVESIPDDQNYLPHHQQQQPQEQWAARRS